MSTSRMHAADFWTSIVFFVVGVYMAVEGLGMPGAGGFIEKGGEPGRVPVLLGVIIALLAVIMMIRAVRNGGYRLSSLKTSDEMEKIGLWRCGVTAVGCTFYAVGLIGAEIAGIDISYRFATAVFVFGFILLAEWEQAPEHGASRWRKTHARWPGLAGIFAAIGRPLPPVWRPYAWLIFNAAMMAIIVSAIVTVVFERYFFVALP